MGMLVIIWPPGWKKQLGLLLALLLLIGGVIASIPWAIDRFGQPRELWTIDQVAQAVERGAVERIVVRGNEATVETKAGARLRVRQETGGSIIDLLRSLAVPAKRLSRIEVLVVPPAPIALTWSSRWLLGVPILILLLGIASIVRPRWGRQARAR